MKTRRLLLPALCALFYGSLTLALHAQGNSHNKNSGNTSWSNNAGWDTGNVPGPADTAIINSGTLTINGAQSIGRLRTNGGDIEGLTAASTDSLTITGGDSNSEWSDGIVRDLTLIIGQAGALNIEGSSSNHMVSAVLEIQSGDGYGLANWTQGTLQLDSGSKIENSGNFDDSAGNRIFTFTGTAGVFNNLADGEYNKIGSGTSEIDVLFNNYGVVNLDLGSLILDGGGIMTSAGSMAVKAGATLRFDNSYTVEDASTITGAGQVELTNGTLTLDGQVSVSDFAIKGGFLTGTHTFNNGATWSEGTIKDGSTTNASTSTFNIQTAAAENNFQNHTLINDGTVNWTDGDIQGDSGTTITNNGTFNDAITDDHEIRRFTGNNLVFTNAGTYHKTGSAKTEIDEQFDNSGTVDIDAGTLVLDGGGAATSTGTFEVNSGATLRFDNNYSITNAAGLTGAGQVELTNGTLTLDGDVNAPDFAIKGGFLTGTHTFNNGATWSEGTIKDGSTTNASTSTFNIQTAAAENNFQNHTFTNDGTVNWTDGDIQGDSGTTITNNGTFNDAITDDHEIRRFTGNNLIINNAGTYHKTGAAKTEIDEQFHNSGTVDIDAGILVLDGGGSSDSTGVFDVASGATLRFDASYTISVAANITGTGQVEFTGGILTLMGDVNVPDFAIKEGILEGTHTFNNGATWSNGIIRNGTTTNAAGSTFHIQSTTGANNFSNHSFINAGTVNWTDDDIVGDSGTTITNDGTFNDALATDHEIRRFTGDAMVFANTGTYRKTGTAKTEVDETFDNSGTVDIDAGTFVLDGGGKATTTAVFDVAAGATLRFDHNYEVASAAGLTGDGTFELTGGLLDIDGEIGTKFIQDGGNIDGNFDIADTFDWDDGSWDGASADAATTILATGILNMEDTTHYFRSRDITNEGTVNWLGGTMLTDSAGSFTNNGTFNDQSEDGADISEYSGSATFQNNGTFLKTGEGVTRIDLQFNNTSPRTLDVRNGTLELNGGGTNFGGGAVVVKHDGLIRFTNNYTIVQAEDLTTESLSGNHGYQLTNGELDLNGQLNVNFLQTGGELEGTHTIAGTFTLEGGDWDANSDGATTTIASTGIVNIQPTGSHHPDYDNRDIINHGTFNWFDGDLDTTSAGSFTNHGTFNDRTDHNHVIGVTTGSATFTNHGTFKKIGHSLTEIDQTFNNDGTVEVESGTLVFDGGGTSGSNGFMRVDEGARIQFDHDYTVTLAAQLTGDGTYELSTGDLDLSGDLSANFEQTGGNLLGSQTIFGDFLLGGWGDWNATSDGALTTIASTGTLNIEGNSRTYHNRDIINEGTVNWKDGDLDTNSSGSFTNRGQFNDLTDHDHDLAETTGSSVFDNEGTYTKSGGSTTEVFQDFTQDGTLELQAGRITFKDELTFTATSGTTVSSGAVLESQNNTDFDGVTIAGDGTYAANGGTLTGSATFNTAFAQTGATVDGDFVFNHSWIYSAGPVADGRDIDLRSTARGSIEPSSFLILDGGSEVKVGEDASLEWSSGLIRTGGNAGIAVAGLMTTNFDGELNQDSAGDGFLNISGGFRKTGGTGTTRIEVPVDLSGRLEAHTGTLLMTAGGMSDAGTFDIFNGANIQISNGFTFNDDTSVQNGGNLQLTGGTFSVNDAVNLGPHAAISGGTVTGTHTLAGNVVVNGGAFDSSGTTTIAEGAALEFAHGEDNPLERSFINHGKILWSDGDMTGSGENSLTNHGEFAVSVDGTFGSPSDDFAIENNGEFNKIGGTGTTVIDVPFTNNGTIRAETGLFRFTDTLTFGEDATLGGGVQFDAPLTLPATSTLAGNGNIMGSITTGGTVSPGNSIGSLSITGDLTLTASSTSFFEVSASTDPISSDFVSVSGTLTLAGTLSWDLFQSLDPVQTDIFTLYTAGNLTGAFQNVANGDRLFAADMNRSFVVNYGSGSAFDANSVIFSDFTFTPIPEPSTWALMMIGLGWIGMRATRRTRRS